MQVNLNELSMNRQEVNYKLKDYRGHYMKALNARTHEIRLNDVKSLMNFNIADRDSICIVPQVEDSVCINDPVRLTEAIRNKEHNVVYVAEALMKTYPIDVLVRGFRKWFKKNVKTELQGISFSDITEKHWATKDLDDIFGKKFIDVVEQHKFDEQSKQPGLVTFYIPFTEEQIEDRRTEDIVKEFANEMYVYGYNVSSYELIEFDDNFIKNDFSDVIVMYITFEAKFADISFEMSEWLYHVTPINNLKNINRQGLVPRSNHSFYDYPDRVYLFNDCDMSFILDYAMSKTDNVGQSQFALLKISSSKLKDDAQYKNGNLKFYIDQKYFIGEDGNPQAMFTYNNVKRALVDDEIVIFSMQNSRISSKKKTQLSTFV